MAAFAIWLSEILDEHQFDVERLLKDETAALSHRLVAIRI
jgi:hypothetical protein